MKHGLVRRIERLEKDPRWQPSPPPSAEDRLFRQKSEELLRTMDEQYAQLVCEDLQRSRGRPARWSGLTIAVLRRALDHVREGRPLAFPADLAQAYVDNPYAGSAAECLECRYKLPLGYYEQCPLCGGPVR